MNIRIVWVRTLNIVLVIIVVIKFEVVVENLIMFVIGYFRIIQKCLGTYNKRRNCILVHIVHRKGGILVVFYEFLVVVRCTINWNILVNINNSNVLNRVIYLNIFHIVLVMVVGFIGCTCEKNCITVVIMNKGKVLWNDLKVGNISLLFCSLFFFTQKLYI